jgi:hypothetical protein
MSPYTRGLSGLLSLGVTRMGLLHLAIPERTLDGNFRWDIVPGSDANYLPICWAVKRLSGERGNGVYMLGNSTHGVLDPGSGVVDTLIIS